MEGEMREFGHTWLKEDPFFICDQNAARERLRGSHEEIDGTLGTHLGSRSKANRDVDDGPIVKGISAEESVDDSGPAEQQVINENQDQDYCRCTKVQTLETCHRPTKPSP